MSFYVKYFFSSAEASLSIVCKFGLNPSDVNSWKMPPNAFNHSEADFDFVALGLMQLQSNEYTTITYQLPLLDH
jgi:hypothetical protein